MKYIVPLLLGPLLVAAFAGLFIWASGCEDRWGDGIAAHPPRVLAHVGTGEGAAIRVVAEGRGSRGEPEAGARGTASD